MTTHYSLSLNPAALQKAAAGHAQTLLDKLRPNQIPVLVYRGMSGVAAATALSFALCNAGRECGMVYIRKQNEDSHGTSRERSLPALCMSQAFVLVFVDDFIASGTTRSMAVKATDGLGDFGDTMFTLSIGNRDGWNEGVWEHTISEAIACSAPGGY